MSKSLHYSLARPWEARAWTRKSVAAAGLLLMLAGSARGQGLQFAFDPSGNFILQTAEASAPPQILRQPQRQVVGPGELASLFVVVADSRAISYQWLFNGAYIPGAVNDALLLTNVGPANQGQYAVVLVNSSGSVTSAPAALMLDSRGCGMPDSWQLAYFGNLNQTADGDFDGDGVSNLQEFLDGTNPTNSTSHLFRLALFSDGGQVTVIPSRFSFTNGETVTLTATAFPPNTFHGWAGDTVAANNPVTLTMTNNKTEFALLGSSYDVAWTNLAGGDWNVGSNWKPNIVPGSNDNVFITNTVTVALNNPTECNNFTLGSANSAPILSGSGRLTLHGTASWVQGTMSGGGRTVIDTGAILKLANASQVNLTSRTLENGGTVLWTGGNIVLNTAVLTNRVGALFETQGAGSLLFGSGFSRFDNAGTFRKSVNTGTTTVGPNISFNNSGTVDLQTGTLALDGGGANSGAYAVPAGTTLNLSDGTFTGSSGSSITGAGSFIVSGAAATLGGLVNLSGSNTFSYGTANLTGNYICTNNTLTISGGTASFGGTGTVAPALLNLSSGTLGGGQLVTVGRVMNWTGGTMSGSGRTVIPAGVMLNLANASQINLTSRTLENGGTVLWTGGNIALNTAVLTNRAGALFETQGAGSLLFGSGFSRFDNAGTFRKSVNTGTTTVGPNISFNNSGTVDLQTGTLALAGGGANSGSYAVPAGTTLNLSDGTFTGSSGSSITGAGSFTVSGAAATLGGLVNLSGSNTFSYGTANLTGNYICTNNALVISGGTASFDGTGTVAPTLLNLSSGTLGGGQLVTVGSAMNWTGGTMGGSGRTVIPAGVMLNVANASQVNLTRRTLENGGTVLWTGGNIALNTAVLTNRAGALFETQGAGSLVFGAGFSRFDNAGTFRKAVKNGTTTVGPNISFNNYGTVDLRTGILAVSGGYASSSNALLDCALGGTNVGTGFGQLEVAGTVTLKGALSVVLTNGFLPATNDSFAVLSAGTRSGAFANFSYPSNEVTMVLSNTATSVIVRVTELLVVPEPILLQPELSGTDIRLTWSAIANTTYRLEYKTDLGFTNWTGLAGDVNSLSNTASNLDALTASNRFYRVRVIP